jgi:hypothetical protein
MQLFTSVSGDRYSVSETAEGKELLWLLTVHNATAADFGNYTCTVSNDAGSSTIHILLLEGRGEQGREQRVQRCPGLPGPVLGLELGLGLAGLFSCLVVLAVAAWFCRSLYLAAGAAREEGSEGEGAPEESLPLRRRRSRSPEPPDRQAVAGPGPVLHTIRPDFAAFYGNPQLSSHLSPEGEEGSGGEEEEAPQHLQFSALYGNPLLSRQAEEAAEPGPEATAPRVLDRVSAPPPAPATPQGPAGERTVCFTEPPGRRTAAPPRAAPSEAAGESLYSEPLLTYRDIDYGQLQLDCGAEEDISTLAD